MLFAAAKRTHFEIPIHWYGQIGGELTTRERGLASGSRPAPPPRTKSPAVEAWLNLALAPSRAHQYLCTSRSPTLRDAGIQNAWTGNEILRALPFPKSSTSAVCYTTQS
jgi:hypothetical protein